MSLDPSAVAVHERTAGPAADGSPLDPAHWWHETWATATSPAIPVGGPLGRRGSSASPSQLPVWVQRVRAAVWPDACSRPR